MDNNFSDSKLIKEINLVHDFSALIYKKYKHINIRSTSGRMYFL